MIFQVRIVGEALSEEVALDLNEVRKEAIQNSKEEHSGEREEVQVPSGTNEVDWLKDSGRNLILNQQ